MFEREHLLHVLRIFSRSIAPRSLRDLSLAIFADATSPSSRSLPRSRRNRFLALLRMLPRSLSSSCSLLDSSLSLSLALALPLSPSLSLPLALSLPLSPSLFLSLSLSLNLSLNLSFPVSHICETRTTTRKKNTSF